MPKPLDLLVNKALQVNKLGDHFLLRLRQQVVGLAEDFWYNGQDSLFRLDMGTVFARKNRGPAHASLQGRGTKTSSAKASSVTSNAANLKKAKIWHAEPGEISEKMWGDGFVTPGGNTINGMLIKPLGLTKEMSVLDLSAGLGGRMRRTAEETGAYITGLEPDAAIAVRGMQLSVKAGKRKHAPITHYDPAKLELNRLYDCIIARETFYRVPDRPTFFAAIGKHAKPHAQIAFTDYILDPEHSHHPAALAWKKNEKLANPMGLVEAAEAWAKVGFSLRVHEDLTSFYKAEVMVGLKRLMLYLASGIQPDQETGVAVLRRIETWKYRMAAIDAGMKFYRFYGTKS